MFSPVAGICDMLGRMDVTTSSPGGRQGFGGSEQDARHQAELPSLLRGRLLCRLKPASDSLQRSRQI